MARKRRLRRSREAGDTRRKDPGKEQNPLESDLRQALAEWRSCGEELVRREAESVEVQVQIAEWLARVEDMRKALDSAEGSAEERKKLASELDKAEKMVPMMLDAASEERRSTERLRMQYESGRRRFEELGIPRRLWDPDSR